MRIVGGLYHWGIFMVLASCFLLRDIHFRWRGRRSWQKKTLGVTIPIWEKASHEYVITFFSLIYRISTLNVSPLSYKQGWHRVKAELSDLPLFSIFFLYSLYVFVFCKNPFQGESDFKEHNFGPTGSQFKGASVSLEHVYWKRRCRPVPPAYGAGIAAHCIGVRCQTACSSWGCLYCLVGWSEVLPGVAWLVVPCHARKPWRPVIMGTRKLARNQPLTCSTRHVGAPLQHIC